MSDKHLHSVISNGSNHLQTIDEQAMTELGAQLARFSIKGSIFYLDGDLGAGKTTLVRGFLRALGYEGAVKSPTFTVVEPYNLDNNKLYDYNELYDDLKLDGNDLDMVQKETPSRVQKRAQTRADLVHTHLESDQSLKIYHFDLYRLEEPEELEYMGIRDYLDGQAIALIEWPEKGYGVLPEADVLIKITHQKQGRGVELLSQSENGANIVSKLISVSARQAEL